MGKYLARGHGVRTERSCVVIGLKPKTPSACLPGLKAISSAKYRCVAINHHSGTCLEIISSLMTHLVQVKTQFFFVSQCAEMRYITSYYEQFSYD